VAENGFGHGWEPSGLARNGGGSNGEGMHGFESALMFLIRAV
jgi:hypothetical protein